MGTDFMGTDSWGMRWIDERARIGAGDSPAAAAPAECSERLQAIADGARFL
jgi:hypothetical protein